MSQEQASRCVQNPTMPTGEQVMAHLGVSEEKVVEDLGVISMRPEETENKKCNYQQEGSSDSNIISIKNESECRTAFCKAFEHMSNGKRQLAQQQYDELSKHDYPNQLFVNVHESQSSCDFTKETDTAKTDLENLSSLQSYLGEEVSVRPHPLVTYMHKNISCDLRYSIMEDEAKRVLSRAIGMDLASPKSQKALGPRIKIAFVSSDIRDHSLSHLISGVFPCFNRSQFDVSVFALNSSDNSKVRNIIENGVDHFYDVSNLQFEDQYKMLTEYDIILNLNGYTSGSCNELFALKPAPIQVMWLGFPGTSGADYMDYILLDNISLPKESNERFSEKVSCLSISHFVGNHENLYPNLEEKLCVQMDQQNQDFVDNNAVLNVGNWKPSQNVKVGKVRISSEFGRDVEYKTVDMSFLLRLIIDSTENVFAKVFWYFWGVFWYFWGVFCPRIPSLRLLAWKAVFSRCAKICNLQDQKLTSRCMYGLPYDKIVFCNFCQNYKYDERTLRLWVQILNNVPDSVLWLLEWKNEWGPKAKTNIISCFSRLGIDEKRIIFSPESKKEEYIRFSQLADVFLDTPLCNGHTTCLDALWAGLPVVTLQGEVLVSGIAASMVTTIRCQELIAKNEDEYVCIAIKLGTNRKKLQSLRAWIYSNRKNCPLFNNKVFCKCFEKQLLLMVQENMTGKCSDRSDEQLKAHFRDLVSCSGNRVEVVVQNIEIDSSSFKTLSKDEDVDKNVVEAYLTSLVQKTDKKAYLISPDILSDVMNGQFEVREGDSEIVNTIERCLGGLQGKREKEMHKIIGAFRKNGHWQLLYINLAEKSTFTVIDPMNKTLSVKTDLEYNWSQFMAFLQKVKPDWSWAQSTFNFKQLPYQFTSSIENCGPLCLLYGGKILSQQNHSESEIYLSNIPTDTDFVNKKREEIGCHLLQMSVSVLDHICRNCSKIDHKSKVLCGNCSQHE